MENQESLFDIDENLDNAQTEEETSLQENMSFPDMMSDMMPNMMMDMGDGTNNDQNTIIIWSDFIAANGPITSDSIIHVSQGTTLVFDSLHSNSPIAIEGLLIEGRVEFEDGANVNYSLSSDWILAVSGGEFNIGSEDTPFVGKATISLTADDGQRFRLPTNDIISVGTDLNPMMVGMLENMIGNDNNNFIMAMGDGSKIDIHGDDASKTSWTKLTASLQGGQGANTITVEDAAGWEVGDVIAISSSFYDRGDNGFESEAEQFTITSINGNMITLDGDIQHDHIGVTQTYTN
ncbi:MAG: G8 domain-containing protein [Pseudomonadota bacterium]